MITRIRGKRIITSRGVVSGFVYFENGIITYVGEEDRSYDLEYDAKDSYVSPGFIDIHTHGAVNVDYGSPSTVEDVLRALSYQARHGATTVLPTITSSSYEVTARALSLLKEAMKLDCDSNLPGVHLEGPFFSLTQSGAQNPELITAPRAEFYQPILEKYGDIIVRWDYAPERDENGEFCRILTERGIIASAGHTSACYDDILVAREWGMNLITHLYSCTSTITRVGGFRHLGVTECAYLFDDLYVEIIADGKHLPPELLRLIFKSKAHDKIILVTDSLSVAGSEAKEASVGGVPCIIEDGVCKLLDRSAFAGSIATADRLVRVAVKEAGIDLPDAVRMLSENPARLLKLNTGAIEAGKNADIIIFDDDINVGRVFTHGREIK